MMGGAQEELVFHQRNRSIGRCIREFIDGQYFGLRPFLQHDTNPFAAEYVDPVTGRNRGGVNSADALQSFLLEIGSAVFGAETRDQSVVAGDEVKVIVRQEWRRNVGCALAAAPSDRVGAR